MASCGYGNSSSSGGNTKPTSKIVNKVFVSNSFSGVLNIVNGDTDDLSAFTVQTGGTPTSIFESQDKSTTLDFDSRNTSIDVNDNATESRLATIKLAGFTDSFLSTKDGKTGYAAVRNGIANNTVPGLIQVLDLRSTFAITASIAVPNVRYISSNNAVTRLLAFSDTSDVVNSIDLTQTTLTPVPVPGTFSRPVAAIFSTDDTKAYILSCGPECGGTQAMVTELTLATGATRSVNVNAARAGTLQGNILYLTGTPSAADCNALGQPAICGVVQKVDITAMSASPGVPIGLGSHTVVTFAGNKVWIGAQACLGGGCLSVYDTTTNAVKVGNANGDVTSIAIIPKRNVVYIVEGGELRIYDIATEVPQTKQVDIIGAAFGVTSAANPH